MRQFRLRRFGAWLSAAAVGLAAAGAATGAPTPALGAQASSTECQTAEAVDGASAARLAATCGSPVEDLSERTENQQVLVNPTGTRTLRASVAPQRVRRADGSWAAVDPTLRSSGGGLVPTATTADVVFSAGGSTPLVTWREGGSTFTLSWPLGPLPTPEVHGATATYRNVLPDVNLHVTATAEGYTHAVELLSARAAADPAVKSLRYRTGGDIRVVSNGAGKLRLETKSGVTVATSASAVMWDSTSDPARGGEVLPTVAAARAAGTPEATVSPGEPSTPVEPAVTARSAPLSVTASGSDLLVTPDAGLMADPGLTYPVFIDPEFEKKRGRWAYSTSNGENNDTTRARVGRQPYPEGGNGELYRSYYDFDITGLRGKKVLSATVRVTLDHSYSCTPTWVHAFRVGAITVGSGGRMSWSTRPMPGSGTNWLDAWEGNANEAGGCGSIQPDTDAEFSSGTLKDDVQYGVNSNWPSYTIGLCACNSSGDSESAQDRWKKFYTDKAWLEATYDTPPSTPSGLTTSAQSCGSTIGTSAPTLKAFYGDTDAASDSLVGYFEYQQLPSGSIVAKTGQTKPGNSYGESGTINLGSGAEGKTYQWRVHTKDSAGYQSATTSWCSFTVDVSKPGMPGVSSTAYPGDGTAHGGPGVSGSFTFTAGAQDVVRYVYGWAGQTTPLTTVTVPAGTSYTRTLTPPRFGRNALEVYSLDGANKRSDTNAYSFLVGAPSAPVGHWPLDTIAGHNLTDQISGAALTPTGTVTWATDSRIIGEGTASFNQNEYLSGTVPALDTSKSFSVSSWVRLADSDPSDPDLDLPDGNWTAVSKSGSQLAAFYLGYRVIGGVPKWSFSLPAADVEQGLWLHVGSNSTVTTKDIGKWTHLAGSYDAATGETRLYVNGVLQGSATRGGQGWNATGPVVMGAGKYTAAGGSPYMAVKWRGQITDVETWDRVLTSDDLWGTDADAATGTQDTAGILAPTEVASWDFNGGSDIGCGSVFSATYWSQSLDLHGCTDPYSDTQNAGYTGDGHDDNDALWLNHAQPDGFGATGDKTGYAATTGPVVDTGQSVTVAAAVRVSDLTGQDQVFARQGAASSQEGACKLYLNQWDELSFTVATPDGAGGVTWASAKSDTKVTAADLGRWIHLVGVFDTGSGEVRLYVDGVRQQAVATGAVGAASPQPLYLGGNGAWGAYLHGDIDQVRVYAGAMSDREATALSNNS